MAFDTAIARAQKKINNYSEISTEITNAAAQAELLLLNSNATAFNRYKNYADANISAFADAGNLTTEITTDYNFFEVGENIQITGITNYNGYYTILSVGGEDNTKITIQKKYIEPSAGTGLVLSQTVNNIIEGLSFLILFNLCNDLRNLEKRGVIFLDSSIQNGTFNFQSVSEIERLQRNYYKQAFNLINGVAQNIVNVSVL